MLWDVLIDRLEDFAPQWVIENRWRDLEWTREPQVREGMRPLIADEARTAQFLASRGVVLNGEAQALFLDCVLDEFIAAILLLERRSLGDYSADGRPSQFPKFSGRTVKKNNGMSPWSLFEAWVKARQPASSGINRWRPVFLDLDKSFGNAEDLTEDDVREWARKLVTTKRRARTVNEVWLSAASTVFGWAKRERLMSSNPFKGMTRLPNPRGCSTAKRRRSLRKRRQQSFAMPLKLERRARPSRVRSDGCRGSVHILERGPGNHQLRGADIQNVRGIHAMKLTPEAGTIKTGKPRTVPIHEHVIEQGFLDFVRSRGKGPLFHDPAEHQVASDPLNPKRPRAVTVRQRLANGVGEDSVLRTGS